MRTLSEIIAVRAAQPGSAGHAFLDGLGNWRLSHGDFAQRCMALGEVFSRSGIAAGDLCAISAASPAQILAGFYGAIAAGARPVVLSPPRTARSAGAPLEHVAALVRRAGGRWHLLAEAEDLVALARQEGIAAVALPPLQAVRPVFRAPHPAAPGDIAYFQATSASTGDARLVAVSHAALIANLEAIRSGVRGGEREVVVSWLPLWHDMGLVGCALFAFVFGYELGLLRPFDFLKRPARWLQAVTAMRGTLGAAPNFAYDHCAEGIARSELQGLDLSSWRHALVGAEPLRVRTLAAFAERFGPFGFRAEALTPAYGLAEATLAVTMAAGGVPRCVTLRRPEVGLGQPVAVEQGPRSIFAGDRASDAGRIVAISNGRPVASAEVALLDEEGRPVQGDLRTGEVAVRGASLALGYYQAGRLESFSGGMLRTGDIGFFLGGELFVLDRLKNVVIRNGQNFFASELENHLAERLAVQAEAVAVFERDLLSQSSEVVAWVEAEAADLPRLRGRVSGGPLLLQDICVSRLMVVPSKSIPRTTSGKKRHHMCRQMMARGEVQVLASLAEGAGESEGELNGSR
jgi:acyl-CoA synthetase (AMP-forming)/AMP-acid ligase II